MRWLLHPLRRIFIQRWLFPKWSETRHIVIFNTIAVGSVALGTAAVLLALAILQGFENAIYRYVTSFTAHIEITGLFSLPIEHYEDPLEYIQKTPNVTAVVPYRLGNALIRPKHSQQFDGVLCKGIPPDAALPYVSPFVQQGKAHFRSDSAPELMIGRLLAERLDLQVNDTVFLLAFNAAAQQQSLPSIAALRVIAVFETGATQFDENVVFLPFETAGRLLGFSRYQATGYDIQVADLRQLIPTAERLNQGLGYRFVARTMYDLYSSLFAWIDLQKRPIPIVLGLIAFVALFNVVSALLTLMVAKLHEIAVLRSLGMQRRQLRQIFLAVGMALVIVGWIIGAGLTLVAGWLQNQFHVLRLQTDVYFFSYLPITFEPLHFLIVAALLLIISFFTIWIPATLATRIPPLQALRFR